MQLVVVWNYLGHVCNYKFSIVKFLGHTILCAINMQLNVYNMDMCYKNNGLNLYILKLLYLICHNLNLGLTTKARACKGANQE
jgi:hypothetical protein